MKNGDALTINGIDYLLEAPIDSGIGSYGRVWAATEIGHGRVVAIKVVNTERMNQIDSSYHRRWSESMEREIAFLEGLQGKAARHIVTLYNHGDCEGQPALVLERMHANLGQWLQSLPSAERAIPLHQLLKWTQQILAGLTVVHDADFIYRDLKFSNVLVNQNGQLLKLADFGTLKHYDGDGTYSYAGTPNTMAPEQALPASYDENQPRYAVEPPQTDYYALGLLLFGLLTGQKSIRAQLEMDSLKQRLGLERANLWDYLQDRKTDGLNDEERHKLREAIEERVQAELGEDHRQETLVPQFGGAAQNKSARIVDALCRLTLDLLALRKEDRPASAAAIYAVLDQAVQDLSPVTLNQELPTQVAFAPETASASPRKPPSSPTPQSDRSSPIKRPHVLALGAVLGLVATLAAAGLWWWNQASIVPATPSTPPMEESLVDVVTPPAEILPSGIGKDEAPIEPPVSQFTESETQPPSEEPPPAPIATAPSITPPAPPVMEPPKPTTPTPKPVTPSASTTTVSMEQPVRKPPAPVINPLPRNKPAVHAVAQPQIVTFRDTLRNGNSGPEMLKLPDRPLAVSQITITYADYDTFARATQRTKPYDGGLSPSARAKHPVAYITWYEAQAYAEWLKTQTGQSYRLPSAAEQKEALRLEPVQVSEGFQEWTEDSSHRDRGSKGISFRVVRDLVDGE